MSLQPHHERAVRAAVADKGAAEQVINQLNGVATSLDGPGAAAGTGVTAREYALDPRGVFHQTVLTVSGLAVAMTDAGAAGCHGTQKVYDFPAGLIGVLGCVTDLTFTAGSGGIADTAAVVGAIGSATVGTNNDTLTSTEADILPSTAATLTGGVGACDGENTAVAVLNGTATAIDANLNIAVPDAGSSASDTITVSGSVTFTWMQFGDN
jgi:hypothetical protein